MKRTLENVFTSIAAFLLFITLFGILVAFRFSIGYLMGWIVEWFTGPLYFTNGHVELPVITGIMFMILTFAIKPNKGD